MHFVIYWKFMGTASDIALARQDLFAVLSTVPILQLLDGLAIVRPAPTVTARFLSELLNIERTHDPALDVAAFQASHGSWYMVSEPVDIAAAIAIAGRAPDGP
ncbi:MAG: hypothetical protein ABMA00_21850 [Gemmatimonas sp.]